MSERVTGPSRQVQSLSDQLRRLSQGGMASRRTGSRSARRSTRKRWSWNDRSGRKVLSLECS
ncbi:MbeD family mobilization/exclusion protein [Escherichia coli]|nr:MbeD family mobilization/exclusion protein [Escherichia coli]